jgi:hypothetical protein
MQQQLPILQAGIIHQRPGRTESSDDISAATHYRSFIGKIDVYRAGLMAGSS